VEIVKPEGEAMHRCPNRACPSRGLKSLINWVQAAADIEGVGEQLVRRLWDFGLVRSIPELYRLTKEQLLELDGFQEKSASNAIASIEASKQVPFHRVLFGLNIPDVGWVTAQTLARHFGSADALAKATQEDIQEIDGMGPLRAESIAEWFAEEENLRLVEELRMLGLRPPERRRAQAGRRAAQRKGLRDHGHARALVARRGEDAARGEGRKGLRVGVGQDDRGHRRRRAGEIEADEGAEGGRAAPHRG